MENTTKKEKRDYAPGSCALGVVSQANMESSKNLLHDAKEIEEIAANHYYDDKEGCALLMLIADYFRKKAVISPWR